MLLTSPYHSDGPNTRVRVLRSGIPQACVWSLKCTSRTIDHSPNPPTVRPRSRLPGSDLHTHSLRAAARKRRFHPQRLGHCVSVPTPISMGAFLRGGATLPTPCHQSDAFGFTSSQGWRVNDYELYQCDGVGLHSAPQLNDAPSPQSIQGEFAHRIQPHRPLRSSRQWCLREVPRGALPLRGQALCREPSWCERAQRAALH